ncbi:hypothetical protein [Promicromonospora umidemergens]|uniref:hypothetical protein n=1 Tax=Promicromonospora umidemergens TaxID=629679 RepID=UPI0020A290B9|nr:hypothetical protein [Promicromonospora umidemergens]
MIATTATAKEAMASPSDAHCIVLSFFLDLDVVRQARELKNRGRVFADLVDSLAHRTEDSL